MRTIFLYFCLLLWAGSALAWEARCVGVSDGDTIAVRVEGQPKTRVRLYGIDAPESGQDFGRRAKEYLAGLVYGETVEVEELEVDRYGRSVAIVRVGSVSANEEMLKAGYAWVYTKYCRNKACVGWKELEQQAKDERRGLWSHKNPVAPWEWRKQKK